MGNLISVNHVTKDSRTVGCLTRLLKIFYVYSNSAACANSTVYVNSPTYVQQYPPRHQYYSNHNKDASDSELGYEEDDVSSEDDKYNDRNNNLIQRNPRQTTHHPPNQKTLHPLLIFHKNPP